MYDKCFVTLFVNSKHYSYSTNADTFVEWVHNGIGVNFFLSTRVDRLNFLDYFPSNARTFTVLFSLYCKNMINVLWHSIKFVVRHKTSKFRKTFIYSFLSFFFLFFCTQILETLGNSFYILDSTLQTTILIRKRNRIFCIMLQFRRKEYFHK